ncbi:redoxin domain-containing protein [Aeoliella mucimassa]|uniref:Thiol-disulfide oxidoreductase ResA n=1 Tax=Aeoliella mucimassa TaxID=2527972 RepID=A0A518AIG2_9BACT|nr:redoxin domain-containing protein [Aeoliella mucimassa]QDU54517.1 Thiol-disulfide oxidoreductase ResA [Aeoliella mucimassa]
MNKTPFSSAFRFQLFCLLLAVAASGLMGRTAVGANSLGKVVPGFELPDHLGKSHTLAEFADSKLVVVAFLGTECPLAKLYAGRLQAIADDYAAQGVAVVAIDANRQDSLRELAAYVHRHELKYPLLKDQANRVADLFGAERTPQVFVLDQQRAIRYQGRVDDQYVVGIVRAHADRQDLRIALDELLTGQTVSEPVTEALGCIIGRVREPEASSNITYSQHVAPILQANCVDCHREGEIGPFQLTDYDEVSGWGEMVVEVVREGRMPPWHANPKHGEFANDRSMSEADKQTIYKWVAAGCPEGDSSEVPPPREYTEGWQLARQPDVVFAMPMPFEVPADAGQQGVPYQYFEVPTNFEKDTWIEATEVQPGNPQVVHHTIVYAQPPEGRRRRDWIFLSAYVPGLRADGLPEKSAKLVPAGSTLIFEMHYTPVGSPQTDVTKMGVLLADPATIEREVVTVEVGNTGFEIPPQDSAYEVTATSRPIAEPVTLLSMSPHMHLRGKAFRYELVTPNGDREILLDVPAYDFNWQTRYVLKEPRVLPAGAVIYCRALFDNSPDNLANPDPNASVRWGDQSWEEMMLGFFDVMMPRDDSRRAGAKSVSTGLDIVGLFDTADADTSGGLDREESKAHPLVHQHFDGIDTNHDAQLQLGEILTAVAKLR